MERYLTEGVAASHAAELTIATRFSVPAGTGRRVPERDVSAAKEEMRKALTRFDETSAQRVLERLFVTFTPTTVTRDVLLPYMRDLGEQWEAGRVSIAEEHFTTNFFQARLLALARGWDRGLGPRALLACAPDERHTLALIVFGIALHELGWRIVYLGADTPIETLSEVAEIVNPELTAVAAVMRDRLSNHSQLLNSFTERWTLVLGGAGVSPQLARRVGARHLAEDAVSAASTVSF
jgi:methanogenic corrinoid protein MtbC1